MSKRANRNRQSAPPGALFETPLSYKWPLFKQLVYIFDNNVLDKLNTPPGHGLGDLLQDLRDPAKPREAVVLLPAVAEANYRGAGGATAVLRKYQGYFEPHFGTYGVQELSAFSLGNAEQSLQENLLEISFRVLVNYWLLCTARAALEGRRKKNDREVALRYFFDAVSAAACYPKSKFPLLAVATALAGNTPGTNALNIKDASVESLMNGSWDLLYWHGLVQLSLDSDRTARVPRFYSYDPDAVGLFLRMERQEDDSLRFVYDSDTPEDLFRHVIVEGMEQVSRAPLDADALVDRIHAVLPSVFRCREYQEARELFKGSLELCCAKAEPDNVFVLKHPSVGNHMARKLLLPRFELTS